MLASQRTVLLSMVQHSRLSLSAAVVSKNHYDSLGITPKATQSDIKAAYYKLSMTYHPDKNKGSDVASEKFRAISEAYEVLGNYKLRKLYDKGILHTAGLQYPEPGTSAAAEDDDQTKFYKSRARRSRAPTTGRTPIYDFDEWTQAHYGDLLSRRTAAKGRYEKTTQRNKHSTLDMEKELVTYGFIICLLILMAFHFASTQSHDIVYQDNKTRQDEVVNATGKP